MLQGIPRVRLAAHTTLAGKVQTWWRRLGLNLSGYIHLKIRVTGLLSDREGGFPRAKTAAAERASRVARSI
jgi:hypothetical protein